MLFGFPVDSDNTIVTNYCILCTKQYIYREKLKEKNKNASFSINFVGYLSYLKNILKVEENICTKTIKNWSLT